MCWQQTSSQPPYIVARAPTLEQHTLDTERDWTSPRAPVHDAISSNKLQRTGVHLQAEQRNDALDSRMQSFSGSFRVSIGWAVD